jgi:hypothetical protein
MISLLFKEENYDTAGTYTTTGCSAGSMGKVGDMAEFTKATATDILKMHDKHNRTGLLAEALNGRPRLCQSCHPDPILGAKGDTGRLNLPAAIHGWHANYLSNRGADACYKCHPSSPRGPTRCLRGVHADSMDCTRCHGRPDQSARTMDQ